MPSATEIQPLAVLLKALADETRLGIVALLAHGELCVCHIESVLELSQPNASRHLAVLRNAGVVAARREGSWMYYRLAPQTDAGRERMLRTLVQGFAKDEHVRTATCKAQRKKGPKVRA